MHGMMAISRVESAAAARDIPHLPQVTLCAVTSINVNATLRALQACLEQVRFAECKLFTDAVVAVDHPGITVVPIARLDSSAAYSRFLLTELVDHVSTSHCLIVQWDGHVIDGGRWQKAFLDYDYIGASWPQFDDGHDVGNGGFSLRSKRLMDACRHPDFAAGHPEDVMIGRTNREWLEERGMRFAPRDLADRFATERSGDLSASFGYHGVFNMPSAIGLEGFWQCYRELDDRSTIWTDFDDLLRMLAYGAEPLRRQLRMAADRFKDRVRAWLR